MRVPEQKQQRGILAPKHNARTGMPQRCKKEEDRDRPGRADFAAVHEMRLSRVSNLDRSHVRAKRTESGRLTNTLVDLLVGPFWAVLGLSIITRGFRAFPDPDKELIMEKKKRKN